MKTLAAVTACAAALVGGLGGAVGPAATVWAAPAPPGQAGGPEGGRPGLVKLDAAALVGRMLWPRFEKGQRVVLRQTARKSRGGDLVIASRVTVDVLEKDGDRWVLRWRVGDVEVPAGLPEDQRRAVAAMVSRMKSPALDIEVQEGVGSVGLRDWEKARDDVVALSEKIIREAPRTAPMDEAQLAATLEAAKRRMSTREATEDLLLKQVRPYFDGAYHEVAPNKPKGERVELDMPLGPVGRWPAERTIRVEQPDPSRPGRLTVHIAAAVDKSAAKSILEEAARQAKEKTGDASAVPAPDAIDLGYTLDWTIDGGEAGEGTPPGTGWPSNVKYRTTQRVGEREWWEEYTWTLVEGPTLTGGEPGAGAP